MGSRYDYIVCYNWSAMGENAMTIYRPCPLYTLDYNYSLS